MNIKALGKEYEVFHSSGRSEYAILLGDLCASRKCTRYDETILKDGRVWVDGAYYTVTDFEGEGVFVFDQGMGNYIYYASRNISISEARNLINKFLEYEKDRHNTFKGTGSIAQKEEWKKLQETKYADFKRHYLV